MTSSNQVLTSRCPELLQRLELVLYPEKICLVSMKFITPLSFASISDSVKHDNALGWNVLQLRSIQEELQH